MTDGEKANLKRKGWFEKLTSIFSTTPKSKEDFTDLLASAQANDIIDSDALEMIEGALNVCDKQVREIMVPRSQMAIIPQHHNLGDILEFVVENRHSRYPVLDENADNITGILLAKELLPLILEGQETFDIETVIRPAAIVPESKRLNILLKEFREQRYHMAIVVDEYGGIAGLITIEDILEEIVGEIIDEYDIDETTDSKIDDKTFTLLGRNYVEEINKKYKLKLPQSDEYETISGLLLNFLEDIPKKDDIVKIESFHFTITNVNKTTIQEVNLNIS